ncbi:MAG: hypothetical protein AAF755_15030 [Pseudomonadota bacterium]
MGLTMIAGITVVAWLISAVGMAGTWIKLCSGAEEHVSERTKGRIRMWFLRDASENPGGDWSDSFVDLFDATFGKRLLSWRFFLRSVAATTLFFALVIGWYIGIGEITGSSFEEFHERAKDDYGGTLSRWQTFQWLIIIFVGNVFADYVSLIETRIILRRITRTGGFGKLVWLTFDAVATAVIYLFFAVALYTSEAFWQMNASQSIIQQLSPAFGIVSQVSGAWIFDLSGYAEISGYILGSKTEYGSLYPDLYQISLITTYFTSIWIWLFLLSGVLSRGIFLTLNSIRGIGRLFDVRNLPMTSLGYVLAVITLVAHVAAYSAHTITQSETPKVRSSISGGI